MTQACSDCGTLPKQLIRSVCMKCYQRRHHAGTLHELPPPKKRAKVRIERTEKHCPRCKTTKPIDDFNRASDRNDGRMGWCRACYAEQRRSKGEHWRNYELERRYGIDTETYDELLEAQGGVCAICGGTPGNRPLAVDHCHDSLHIRGLLCANCNRGIGLFKDDPRRLQSAIAYLAQEPSELQIRPTGAFARRIGQEGAA